jgi:hypothetical protein
MWEVFNLFHAVNEICSFEKNHSQDPLLCESVTSYSGGLFCSFPQSVQGNDLSFFQFITNSQKLISKRRKTNKYSRTIFNFLFFLRTIIPVTV